MRNHPRSRPMSVVSALLCVAALTCSSRPQPQLTSCVPDNDKKKPLICVDAAGEPNPKSQAAHDMDAWWWVPWKKRVTVTWRAQEPRAKLTVAFDDDTCVNRQQDVKCSGPQCTAKLKKIDWDGSIPNDKEQRDCKYKTTITLDGNTIDPWGELIVNPCCT